MKLARLRVFLGSSTSTCMSLLVISLDSSLGAGYYTAYDRIIVCGALWHGATEMMTSRVLTITPQVFFGRIGCRG
ncbi:hypothetical protein F5141DRAFT_1110351 [Pisolithus sp. B1]|nr:hypothetical protein F5141DRAFT_1110351 [Pisolithus sp. B1]